MSLPRRLTKQAFLHFCQSKDPEETYSYTDLDNCAIAQYGKFLGIGQIWNTNFGDLDAIVAVKNPHTFGALAKRIEALCEEEKQRKNQGRNSRPATSLTSKRSMKSCLNDD